MCLKIQLLSQGSHGLAVAGPVLEQVPAVVDGGGAQLLLHGDHQQHHVLPPLLLRLPLLPVLHLRQVVPHLSEEFGIHPEYHCRLVVFPHS